MTQRTSVSIRTVAIALAAATGVLTVAALTLQALAGPPDVAETLLVSVFGLLGLIVALRAPGNALGWLFLAIGLTNSIGTAASGVMYAARDVWHTIGLAQAAAVVSSWPWIAFLGLVVTYSLLLFPDGRLPSPRWRWVAYAAGAAIIVGCVLQIGVTLTHLDLAIKDADGDVPVPLWVDLLFGSAAFVLLAAAIASIASLIVRWRRAEGIARQQLKWFLFGGLVQIGGIMASFADHPAATFVTEASILSLPCAATLAIVRYRLYDIDRLISRTLAWALLTVILGGVYLAGVTLLTSVTASVAGGSPFAVAAATLATAAAFGPARRRIQSTVDRRFNRARYDATQTAEAYRSRLRDQLDLESIAHDLVTTARATVHPTVAAVLLIPPGGRA